MGENIFISDEMQKRFDKMVGDCPCCGSSSLIEVFQVRKGWEADIHCNGCLLNYHTITYDTPEEAGDAALKGWNNRVGAKCGTCRHFLGGEDWDLCCELSHPEYPCGFLCYEDTAACDQYIKK